MQSAQNAGKISNKNTIPPTHKTVTIKINKNAILLTP